MSIIKCVNKGNIDYATAFDFQTKMLEAKVAQKLKSEHPKNHIIFCEHPHVYTLGKSGDKNNLLIKNDFLKKINASYHQSNRGGDITYHGPGQIVGYPIVDLEQLQLGIKEYVFQLEQAIIKFLNLYGINSELKQGATGVWLDTGQANERKICAIGIKVSRGITMHGFALNVSTDLSYFNHINPCGFQDKGVTSMEKETGKKYQLEVLIKKLHQLLVKYLTAKINQ